MGKSHSKLESHIASDLLKNTHFDKKEIQYWYDGFMKEYPLGYLTKHDFQRLYQQFFPFGQVEPFAQIMFNMFDINRNGKLEFYEYTLALSITTRGKFTEKLKWSFQLYDLDKDGLISKPEMLLVLESLYKLLAASRHRQEGLQIQETPLQRLEHLFALMDLNKDDMIDFEEYCQRAKEDPIIIQSLFLYDGLV